MIMAYILLATKILLIVCGVVFTWNGIEELSIDLYWIFRTLYRKFFVMKKYKPLDERQLQGVPEKPVAILIPCWDESAVIRNMVENTLRTLNYSNYTIFVGTYPNDPETRKEIDIVREHYDNVERITCPKNGPTNKADCLNWVFEGIRVYEKEHDRKFEIFVIEDAEDILHPLTLKLFNYLIPRKDMIQLPVLPIAGEWYQFTRNHYLDEFAENHTRDLVVRESLTKILPSAGVGTALSRRTVELLREKNRGQILNVHSLAEDYELGLEMGEFNLEQIFVRKAIEREITLPRNGKIQKKKKKEYIAVQEFFPKRFTDAVRQKSRWVVGIALQGWSYVGWYGSFMNKFMLYRDRKSLITNQINLLGNVLAIFIIGLFIYEWKNPSAYHYPPLISPGTLLWTLLLINLFFLCWRLTWRVCCVWNMYGPAQALLAIPRLPWSNCVNFFATIRAIWIYARYKATGKIIPWEKTEHVYPTEEELRGYRQRLGDLLIEKRFITLSQLEKALMIQKEKEELLGKILLDMGFVSENILLQALGQQFGLEIAEIDPYKTPLDLLKKFPRRLAIKYSVFPIGISSKGAIEVGTETLLPREVLSELENQVGKPIVLKLVTHGDISLAIRKGYERLTKKQPRSRIGEIALRRGKVAEEDLRKAARMQKKAYKRLGEILVNKGLVTREELKSALDEYLDEAVERVRFGEYLVEKGLITRSDLEHILKHQELETPKFGELLVRLGLLSESYLDEMIREQENE